MGDQEFASCDCCGNVDTLSRKYFYYKIDCECCSGDRHFEIVRYCDKCTPKKPNSIKPLLSMEPDEE